MQILDDKEFIYFPTSPNWCFALPGKAPKHESCTFLLTCCTLLCAIQII